MTETEAAARTLVAQAIRRSCTPSGEAYQAGGDRLVYAVADWIENPPEWVTLPADLAKNHPDGTGATISPLVDFRGLAKAFALAIAAKASTDHAAHNGLVTWRHVLLEEVFEAFAEDDPVKLRAELIQVAAVAEQWAEAIDRRGGA